MARFMALAALLALLLVCASPAAEARRSSRRLNSPYPKSGSSPDTSSSPYPKTGGSPDVSNPSPDVSNPSPDTDTPTPDTDTPTPDTYTPTPTPDTDTPSPDTDTPTPDISSPSPVTIPPVTSTPSGRYGGYGAHAGCGTPKFWMGNPGRIPKLLSLVSSVAKLFGPRILGLIGGHKTMLGAIKDESPEAFPSLARQGATSLINAYAYNDFPLSASDVVNQLNAALDSSDLARDQALKFQRLNEAL